MAIRTTHDEVKEIIPDTSATDAVIDHLIEAASAIIDKVFAEDVDISSTLLAGIEKWFTAHMIASSISRTASEEKVGDASVKYTGKWGAKLESTPYGQMCITLDFTGKLSRLGKSAVNITAIESFD